MGIAPFETMFRILSTLFLVILTGTVQVEAENLPQAVVLDVDRTLGISFDAEFFRPDRDLEKLETATGFEFQTAPWTYKGEKKYFVFPSGVPAFLEYLIFKTDLTIIFASAAERAATWGKLENLPFSRGFLGPYMEQNPNRFYIAPREEFVSHLIPDFESSAPVTSGSLVSDFYRFLPEHRARIIKLNDPGMNRMVDLDGLALSESAWPHKFLWNLKKKFEVIAFVDDDIKSVHPRDVLEHVFPLWSYRPQSVDGTSNPRLLGIDSFGARHLHAVATKKRTLSWGCSYLFENGEMPVK